MERVAPNTLVRLESNKRVGGNPLHLGLTKPAKWSKFRVVMPPSFRARPPALAIAAFSFLFGIGRPAAAQTTTYTPYNFTTVAGTVRVAGSANGTGTAAQFNRPQGLAVDANGNIYVADASNQTIRKIAPGGLVTTVAGSGTAGGVNGTGTAATFDAPLGVAVDASGNLYVADGGNDVIRKIAPGGVVTTLAGAVGTSGTADGTGVLAKFNQPYGVAVDASGNVYVADYGNNTIREVTPGGTVTTIAGAAGLAGSTDATGAAARFNKPYGVAVDASGNIYVADTGNNRIREIMPGGVVTTLAGSTSGYGDGTGTAAQFASPRGVAVDASGNVYVADTNDAEIRKIASGAVVTTLAGGASGGADGAGFNAGFNNPSGVAVDANGTVYVADTSDDTIRSGVPFIAPTFTLAVSPATATVASGRTFVFNAIATGMPAPAYQWRLNGSATIPGATVTNDPILVITGATSGDVGTVTCTATNAAGSVSSSASLAVTTTSNPGYLTNLSGRGVVGSGPANALFGGFGTAGTGTKNLLIRGMGPSTTMVGIPAGTELASTQLTLYDHLSVEITQNTDWAGNATISTIEAQVGAYPVPANSLDSMLYVQEPVSVYSASVGGVGGATGIAVVELYDADTPPLASRLVNLSVRAPVGTGNNILFGGFSIGGTTDDAILIRAIGPSLASQLSGFLVQPVLTIFQGANPTPLYSNTVWGGDPALVNAENVVGAYPISTSSQDSLLLVSLPAGNYTAEITGVNYTTGIAVVEIYEVF